LTAAIEGIVTIMEQYGHSRISYFGDLDLEGIDIAARFARALMQAGKELALDPRLYRLVLERGRPAPSLTGGAFSIEAAQLVDAAGLGSLRELCSSHQRMAQEWAGYRRLKEWFAQ
jgi:hypothetical protein